MDEEILNRNKNINRGFRKLEVWKLSTELYKQIKIKVRTLPDVPLKIRSQVEDSAFSISSNIAEGYGRRSLKEYINFLNIALSSLAENYSQVFNLFNAGDIDKKWFDDFDKQHYELENKLIQMNKSLLEKLKSNEWKDDYVLRDPNENYYDVC